jgi:hypothetical protein
LLSAEESEFLMNRALIGKKARLGGAMIAVTGLLFTPPALIGASHAKQRIVTTVVADMSGTSVMSPSTATPRSKIKAAKKCQTANRYVTVPMTKSTKQRGDTYRLTTRVTVGLCTDRRASKVYKHSVAVSTVDHRNARVIPRIGKSTIRANGSGAIVRNAVTVQVKTRWGNKYTVVGELVTSVSAKGVVTTSMTKVRVL